MQHQEKHSKHWFPYLQLSIGIFISLLPLILYASSSRFNSDNPFYSYIGGENTESAYAIAIDSKQNIFLTGVTNSNYFDNFDILPSKIHLNQNCFIAKISSTNPNEDFIYEFAGSERETCREIAIDSENNIYLTGETNSNDLPVTTNTQYAGEWDSFLLKLSNNGILLYATYIGGSLTDYGHGLVIESVDQVYITGETWSTDFPTTENSFMPECELFTSCNGDKANAFLIHLDTRNPFNFISDYSTYIGGSNQDKAHDLAVDLNGHLHIVGETRSDDFPLNNFPVNAQFSNSLNGTYDGFLVIIDPTKSQSEALTMSTYIGGSDNDYIFAITTDSQGSSYLTGETWSDDFPVTDNAFASQCAKSNKRCNPTNKFERHSDVFITIVSHSHNAKTSLLYSSLFGGTNQEIAQDILFDTDSNKVFITGTTWSDDFPITTNGTKSFNNEFSDGFLIGINLGKANDGSLIYSSYLGGSDDDNIYSFFQMEGEIFLTGETYSDNLANNQTLDSKIESGEAFVQKIPITEEGIWLAPPPQKATTTPRQLASSAISPGTLFLLLLTLFHYRRQGYLRGK